MNILSLNLAGTILICAVILIRFTMSKRIPRSMMRAIWLIPLLRLLVPIEIPFYFNIQSIISRHSVMKPVVSFVHTMQSTEMAVPATGQQIAPMGPAHSVWFYIWMVGISIVALVYAVVTIYSYREFCTSLPIHSEYITEWLKMHRSIRKISVRSYDRISTPLTYGMLNPVILLPSSFNLEDKQTLGYVLEHEYVHIRSCDVWYKLLFLIATCIYWFNPMVWLMLFFVNKDMELACDEKVIRNFGAGSEKIYAGMLVCMEAARSNIIMYSGFSRNAVKERIGAIVNRKRTSWCCVFLAVALVVCSIGLFATSAQAAYSQKDDVGHNVASVEYVGNYVMDAATTEANLQNNDSLLGLFGTGLGQYGAFLNINSDGTLNFELGAGPVMEGNWQLVEDGIYSRVKSAEGMIAPADIYVVVSDGKVCFRYFDEMIYWNRVSDSVK